MANPNPPAPPNNTGKKYNRTAPNYQAQAFAKFYMTPTSESFMNVRQSALRAGYSETYANNITVQRPEWWVELIDSAEYQRAAMLKKAQSRLDERLSDDVSGDANKLKIQTDVAKFISERLGKEHYSTRQEVTGADGKRLFDNEQRMESVQPLANLFKGVSKKGAK